MTDGTSHCQKPRWGAHSEFAGLYEHFLDAVYKSTADTGTGCGRANLVQSIASILRTLGVGSILDCAAGSGFPALDLLRSPSLPRLEVHCTDSDLEMLDVLAVRAKRLLIDIRDLRPPGAAALGSDANASLQLGWGQLGNIRRTYDYVMCRGNSLAYADTWSGGHDVSSIDLIREYLENMVAKVRRGGHLHVDAPWRLALPQQAYKPMSAGLVSIWEQVTNETDHRYWRADFKYRGGRLLKFERFSTLLTIYDVKTILDDLGLEETEPFQLAAERPGYGVIIARRPR